MMASPRFYSNPDDIVHPYNYASRRSLKRAYDTLGIPDPRVESSHHHSSGGSGVGSSIDEPEEHFVEIPNYDTDVKMPPMIYTPDFNIDSNPIYKEYRDYDNHLEGISYNGANRPSSDDEDRNIRKRQRMHIQTVNSADSFMKGSTLVRIAILATIGIIVYVALQPDAVDFKLDSVFTVPAFDSFISTTPPSNPITGIFGSDIVNYARSHDKYSYKKMGYDSSTMQRLEHIRKQVDGMNCDQLLDTFTKNTGWDLRSYVAHSYVERCM